VANAVGAALCKVSGMVDGVFEVDAEERDSALANIELKARREAILNGADPDTIEVLEITATQLSYLKGNQTRICIKVVGDLADVHALTRELLGRSFQSRVKTWTGKLAMITTKT
ncbi:predicted protein, partial [Nematostella vectensis]